MLATISLAVHAGTNRLNTEVMHACFAVQNRALGIDKIGG